MAFVFWGFLFLHLFKAIESWVRFYWSCAFFFFFFFFFFIFFFFFFFFIF